MALAPPVGKARTPAARTPTARALSLPPIGASVSQPREQQAAAGWSFGDIAISPPSPRSSVGRARLQIGPADDPAEHEADRVADSVMRMPAPPPAATVAPAPPHVPDTAAADHAIGSGGAALDPASRQFFEPRLGRDLSGIRVHADANANVAAERYQARAFTVGSHIAFGAGEFAPHTHAGRSLMAHELAHVGQHRPGADAVLRRKKKEPEAKPEMIAITAVYGELTGRATLATGDVVDVELTENQLPLGRSDLILASGHDYVPDPTSPSGKEPQRAFKWRNKYGWAKRVRVDITPTASQRVLLLAPEIRALLTTDRGKVASPEEIEATAEAGEMLAQAGVTEDELILLETRANEARETGRGELVTELEPAEFAKQFLEARRNREASIEAGRGDLVSASKLFVDEPVSMATKAGGLAELFKENPLTEVELGKKILWYYQSTSQTDKIPPRHRDDTFQAAEAVLGSFRGKLLNFEALLLQDLGAHVGMALDAADAAILKMDRLYTGMYTPSKPPPINFWRELTSIHGNKVIQQAAALREKTKDDLDRDSKADFIESVLNRPLGFADRKYDEREALRDKQRDLASSAYTQVVRRNSRLNLPPGVDAQDIVEARDEDRAVELLADYLYNGREKIEKARGRLTDRKFMFAGEIWVGQEAEQLKGALGAGIGDDIGKLAEAFAVYRKSQTSFWDDLLHFVQFVAMFIPGPIGWVLRAGTAIIEFNQTMGRLNDESIRLYSGGSLVRPSSGEALKALVDLAMGMLPEGAAAEEGAERTAGRELPAGEQKALPPGTPEGAPEPVPGSVEPPASEIPAGETPKPPETEPPRTELPQADAPHSEPPKPPDTEPPKTEVPKPPETEPPKVEAPKPAEPVAPETTTNPSEPPTAKPEPKPEELPHEPEGGGGGGGPTEAPVNLEELKEHGSRLAERSKAAEARYDRTLEKLQERREFLDEAAAGGRKKFRGKSVSEVEEEVAELEQIGATQSRELEQAKGELAEAESEIMRHTPPDPSRPTWRQSEQEVKSRLDADFDEQKSFLGGVEQRSNVLDSAKPDFVNKARNRSVEVKNYDIAKRSNQLISNVVDQAIYRTTHLPKGMQQMVAIDIRRQVVSMEQRAFIRKSIAERSKGAILPGNVIFISDVDPL